MKLNIVILTGAGISQESGIQTFRDANGLWKNTILWKWHHRRAGNKIPN